MSEAGKDNGRAVDAASKLINAPIARVYHAFANGHAMQQWLPPDDMTGDMLEFDFREGGWYRLRLTYTAPDHGPGKTSADADEVAVQFTRLIANQRIEQRVTFDSEDPRFAGEMKMTWDFEAHDRGTMVTVRCEDVPEGISPDVHELALNSTLAKLARFVEDGKQ